MLKSSSCMPRCARTERKIGARCSPTSPLEPPSAKLTNFSRQFQHKPPRGSNITTRGFSFSKYQKINFAKTNSFSYHALVFVFVNCRREFFPNEDGSEKFTKRRRRFVQNGFALFLEYPAKTILSGFSETISWAAPRSIAQCRLAEGRKAIGFFQRFLVK